MMLHARAHALLLAVALPLLGAGCFGRANRQIKSIEEDREGGATTTFKYDDDGYLERVTREQGEAIVIHRLKWKEGVLSAYALTTGEVTVDYEITVDADDRVIGWGFQTDTGDESATVLTYDEEDRLISVKTEADNVRNGASADSETTWVYQGDVLERVDTSASVRSGGNRESSSSSSAYTFDDGKLVELVQDVGSVRTTTEYTYDDDDLLSEAESQVFGGGSLTTTGLRIDRNKDGLVGSYEKSVLEDDERLDPYDINLEYNEDEARGVEMAPAEIGGLWDLRGTAYTAFDAELSPLRSLVTW